jgi:hypothetical protein
MSEGKKPSFLQIIREFKLRKGYSILEAKNKEQKEDCEEKEVVDTFDETFNSNIVLNKNS